MERRNFLKCLAAVPFAPVLLRGMDWMALEPAVAAARGSGGFSAAVPPGTILPFAGTRPPPGFLPCDGRPVPKVAYKGLYAALGAAYGGGRFVFRVPDLVSRPVAAVALDKKLREAKNPNPIYDRPNFQYVIRT